MARLIKNNKTVNIVVSITTCFANGTYEEEHYKVGDLIENLRFVKDGEIVTVTGRLVDIGYTMVRNLSWNKKSPKNTIQDDMKLTNLTIDISSQYNAETIEVPVKEIVEFDSESDVTRMIIEHYIVCDMEMHYSNFKVKNVSVQAGDIFDNVLIINPSKPGTEFTGKAQVIGFDYSTVSGVIKISGIAFKNVDTEETIVADFDNILSLNELFSYDVSSEEALTEILNNVSDGDTVTFSTSVDTTNKAININKQKVQLIVDESITTDGSDASGIRISNGSAILSGNGLLINNTNYDSNHGSGVIGVKENGELIFNGSGVSAVADTDPANNGQFGVCLYDNGKVTVNDGTFNTGWYCISGNGSKTNADSVVEINGGTFTSVADYAIYHPQPGKLIINDGVIKGAAGAIAANNGTIIINGGEFSVLGGGQTGDWSDGTGGLGNAALNLNAKYGDITCVITGGTFYATAEDAILIATGSAHNVFIEISGGKFTSKPNSEWIAEGYAVAGEADENGLYAVYKQ